MRINNNIINLILLSLTVAALFGTVAGSNEPVLSIFTGTALEDVLYKLHIGSEIISSLSVGFLISLFFWFLVVRLPETRKRRILKSNLASQYQHFKEDTIQILLFASIGSYDSQLPQQLCDYIKFKEFFGANNNEKWSAALNGMQEDNGYINDILVEMELIANEISYILNNVDIDDDKIYIFLKNFSSQIYKLKNSSIYTNDHVKSLGQFLWGILAQWSFVDGQREEDIIQNMIDNI